MTHIDGVRQERTGWRDLSLSLRHRKWGKHTPAVDIDFLLIEYISSRPVALVEYKSEFADKPMLEHPSFRALVYLADGRNLPAFCVRYGKDFGWFDVMPLNETARRYVKTTTVMSEADYVEILYKLRGSTLPDSIRAGLRQSVTA